MTPNGGPARLLRVYGVWIVLITAVVMAAAYGVSTLSPTVYRSGAIVVVQPRVLPNTNVVPPEMGTEKQLAGSGLIINPAAKRIGVDPGVLATGLDISVATDANVLTFAFTDKDPWLAQQRAQALAQAYVDYRNAGEDDKNAAAGTTAGVHATLVTPAFLPGQPESRPVWIDLSIGLVLGLLLGIGTALLRDRLSDKVRGRGDLEQLSGVPVLATVPRVRKVAGPVLLRAPESPAAEAYRYLRTRIQPLFARDGAGIVLVTSAREREGRSMTAANLALALAAAGRTVVLVDADLRGPIQHTLFGLDGERGLTSLLLGEAGVDDALRDGPVPRLRVLAAGPGADGATDLLEGPRLSRVLRAVRRECDIVVLDSAAVLSVSDAIALATVSDHVLFVADYRRTTRASVTRALAELAGVTSGNVSALLLNAPKSAGGLVPRARGASPSPAPDEETDPLALLGPASPAEPLTAPVPAVGSAAVPKSLPAPTSAPTVYSSATVISDPIAGKKPGVLAGPVKQRSTNGTAVPAPRTNDSQPPA